MPGRGGLMCCSLVSKTSGPKTFVWVEVAGVRVYSCHFSLNGPFEVFGTQIVLLEESLSEAVGRLGDFENPVDFAFGENTQIKCAYCDQIPIVRC